MKVLHVIDKSFLGGGQTVVRNLVQGFRGSPIETAVACRDGGPLVEACRSLGAPVHPVPFDKRFRPGPARRLAAVAREEGAHVIHAHGLVATSYCMLARTLFALRTPLVYHMHGFHHHNYGRLSIRLRIEVERAVCRRVERVIASSRLDRQRLEEARYAPPERIRLVYYGIPENPAGPGQVEEARREARLRPGQPVLGAVARLHPQKGIDVLLHAVRRLRDEVPDLAVVVVGGGEIESSLHALARELGLTDTVRFMGGRSRFAPFLRLFDVAVLPSRWEGLPIILLEYLAAGLPIVSTNVDGCPEVLGADHPELVPPEDVDALSAAILRLLRDPGLRSERSRAARARYLEAFALPVMIERFRDVYAELAGGARGDAYRVT
jgi:glycosyltransferase involved in cell wall biosynthesis